MCSLYKYITDVNKVILIMVWTKHVNKIAHFYFHKSNYQTTFAITCRKLKLDFTTNVTCKLKQVTILKLKEQTLSAHE